MPSPERGVRVEAIREAARMAVSQSSLRAVARAVGLSPMGLRNFLDGTQPYRATLRKLTIWYVRHGAQGGAGTDVIRSAMSLMLEGLPEDSRGAAEQALLAVVEQMHHRARTHPPGWLATLRAELDLGG